MGLGVFLQYGGFYGGDVGTVLSQWEQLGVFSYMLPFLIIFSLVFGILSKLKLFGDGSKTINAIISLAVGLMALQFGVVTVFFSDILPRLGIALIGFLVVIVLIGLVGDPKNKALSNTLMWGGLAIAAIVIIQSLGVFRLSDGPNILGIIPPTWIPWVAFLVLVGIIVAASRDPDKTPSDSPLFRALRGE